MHNFYLRKTTILVALLCLVSKSFIAQDPHLALTPVITGLTAPIQVTNAGDGTNRLFVVLQGSTNAGYVLVYDQSYVKLDTFLRVTNIVAGGERGLLSIAFHPDYGNNASPFFGLFYVYYTNSNGDLQIARYSVSADPNQADPNSKDTVITIPHPVNSNHNGGTIRFGPDGYLYLATGDGGSSNDPPGNAQNPNVLLGKMIRLNVTSSATAPFYTIPVDNPYVGVTTPDTLDEIYAFGLRNPFRWSFDKSTGDIWIGDVGQGTWEEIDFKAAGSTAGINYGWRCYEGNATNITTGCGPMANYTFPIFTYPNPGGAAVTGGVVYRGSAPVNAALNGFYVATDYYSGTFYKIRPNGSGGWTVYTQPALRTGVPSIGEAENGEIFVISQFANNVLSLAVDAVLPARLAGFTAELQNNNVLLKWRTSFEEHLSRFIIQYSTDGTNFQQAGEVAATNSSTGASYSFIHPTSYPGKLFYRLVMVNIDNSSELSAIVSVERRASGNNFIQPSVITNNMINIRVNESYDNFELMSIKGEVVYRQSINGRTGSIDVVLPRLTPGTYIARLQGRQLTVQQKVIIR